MERFAKIVSGLCEMLHLRCLTGFWIRLCRLLLWSYPLLERFLSGFCCFTVTKVIRDHSFSASAEFSEELTFLTPCYAHVHFTLGLLKQILVLNPFMNLKMFTWALVELWPSSLFNFLITWYTVVQVEFQNNCRSQLDTGIL